MVFVSSKSTGIKAYLVSLFLKLCRVCVYSIDLVLPSPDSNLQSFVSSLMMNSDRNEVGMPACLLHCMIKSGLSQRAFSVHV